MDYAKESLKKHYEWRGKMDMVPKMGIHNRDDLSLAYTPGVAEPCLEIHKDVDKSYDLTGRWNTVAVVTDGTAVLGLGDIGPEAGMPVMEGKCVLFKAFAGINAVPLCIRSKEIKAIVDTVSLLAGSFGGINLEDISAPRCFEIERRLKEICDIPVFHDDQHGTAVVVLAALINALKLSDRKLDEVTVVTSGAGSAGMAIVRLLMATGLKKVIMCDKDGVIYEGKKGLSPVHQQIAKMTNREMVKGSLVEALVGADVFIGVSAPGVLSQDMVRSMRPRPIIFAMANPTPEIMPDLAIEAGAFIVGTGRSDYPNQINNVLAFPGIFRGALDTRASDINDEMKLAAAWAIAEAVKEKDLAVDFIIPPAFDLEVQGAVGAAVAEAAIKSGIARKL